MEDLNNVPSSGTYGAAINEVNANFSLVVNAINSLEYATTKSKGIYNNGFTPSTTTLPNSVSGDWCMVLGTGNTFPARIWTFNGTTWAQGGTWNPDGINLNGYATTTALNTAVANSLLQATARMGYCEATISNTTIEAALQGYLLPVVPSTGGGNVRIKMPSKASVSGTYTLNINSTGAKEIMYNGLAVSPTNTWDSGEVVVVYYTNNKYWAKTDGGVKIDTYPTANSKKAVSSGGVYSTTPSIGESSDGDFELADELGNVILRLERGHVVTKNFNSQNIKTDVEVDNSNEGDFEISDEQNNVLAIFINGHVKTKRFDSSKSVNSNNSYLRTLEHPLSGKKVGFLGASITAGYLLDDVTKRYSTVLCNMIGCTEVNLGVPGTCVASNTLNNKNSTRFVTRVTQQNIGDLDFLFVKGGSNDFTYDSKPIGDHFNRATITPPSNLIGNTQLQPIADTDTFAGGLHDLILAIREINYNLPMAFITPIPRGRFMNGVSYTHDGVTYSGARAGMADANIHGNYFYEFDDAIVDITRFYSIPCIPISSLFNNRPNNVYNNNDGISDLFVGDGDYVHLTVAGNERLAKLLFNWTLNNIII